MTLIQGEQHKVLLYSCTCGLSYALMHTNSIVIMGNLNLQHFFSVVLRFSAAVFLASAEFAAPLSLWALDMLKILSELV